MDVDGDLHSVLRADAGDGMERNHRLCFVICQGVGLPGVLCVFRVIYHLQVEEALALVPAALVSAGSSQL